VLISVEDFVEHTFHLI